MITLTQLLIFTAVSGILGTGLGGVLGVIGKKNDQNSLAKMLAFAAGIMISVVCFDITPESFTLCAKENIKILPSILLAILSLILGMVLVAVVTKIINKFIEKKSVKTASNRNMFASGWVIFFAIALHNLPEGMAIGGGSKSAKTLGVVLAILIGLHNVPEGMSISAPLHASGISKVKSVLLSALGGASTVGGGLLGWGLAGISPVFSAVCMLSAGGAMLYITFSALLPDAYGLTNKITITNFTLSGIIVGMAITFLLNRFII